MLQEGHEAATCSMAIAAHEAPTPCIMLWDSSMPGHLLAA